MWNIVGHVHFALPGVFANNPLPSIVNGQLWTIPFELYCYITLAAVTFIGLKRSRKIGPLAIVGLTLVY
jgi:peptidoglycan/LPS O-acetylase OafA/YrhL